jgi:hypothetical protein
MLRGPGSNGAENLGRAAFHCGSFMSGIGGIAIWRLPGSAPDDGSAWLLGRRRCVLGSNALVLSHQASRPALHSGHAGWSPTS